MTIDREGVTQAAEAVEAALNREHGEPDLATNLADRYRAAVTILRDAANPAMPEAEAEKALGTALVQRQTPPVVFRPANLTRDLGSARIKIDRARRDR